jgi:hypothetical protein
MDSMACKLVESCESSDMLPYSPVVLDPEDGGNIFSKMSVDFQWTTCYIPKDGTVHNHCCENLKSYMVESCHHFG